MISRRSKCQCEPPRGLPSGGDIYALRTIGELTRHYWLCEECAEGHILRLNAAGLLFIADRSAVEAQPMLPLADLRLVFRMADSPNHEKGSRIYACNSME
jgi:hypothetical protein